MKQAVKVSPSDPNQNKKSKDTNLHRPGGLPPSLRIIAGSLGALVLFLLVWLNLPVAMHALGIAATATLPPTPLPTQPPTRTPTPSLTPSPSPTPSPPPLPTSKHQLQDLFDLYPSIPGVQGTAIVLNEHVNVTVSPDFSHPQWSHSATIEAQIGYEIAEPYYATLGSAMAIWMTDVPLDRGAYEIYFLDTLYSSAGSLEFLIRLGDMPLQPVLGNARIDLLSTRFEPRQIEDQWRYLGLYLLDQPGWLSVTTAWEARDLNTIVAIDRVLIVRLPETSRQLLDRLPPNRLKYVLDDDNAEIRFNQPIYSETNHLAWGDQYQYIINPAEDLTVTWTLPELAPVGQYEVLVWIPEEHATAEVSYRVLINDNPTPHDNGFEELGVNQRDIEGGNWYSLGTWSTPRIYEFPVKLSLILEARAGSNGEVGIDAVALVKMP